MKASRAGSRPRPPSIVDTYRQTDLGKRIAERDAIDRRAEFVARLALVLLACAGLAALFLAVKWATS